MLMFFYTENACDGYKYENNAIRIEDSAMVSLRFLILAEIL